MYFIFHFESMAGSVISRNAGDMCLSAQGSTSKFHFVRVAKIGNGR
jgi:hypothetical protein